MAASILAWPGAVAIGVSLGLLGSGGSIITVPVLVYLVGQDEKLAIAGSLFIVGSIAGAKIANRIPQQRLKRGFGYFLIVMGVYILARSVPQVLQFAA